MEKDNLERKILVVDDAEERIGLASSKFGDSVEHIYAAKDPELVEYSNIGSMMDAGKTIHVASSEQDIAKVLGSKQYGVILMDGNLRLDIDGEYFDGGVVSRKLRAGAYGSLNQQTPIVNTSSNYDNPFAESRFSLDKDSNGTSRSSPEDFQGLVEKYLQ